MSLIGKGINYSVYCYLAGPNATKMVLLKESPFKNDLAKFNVSLIFTFIVREGPPTTVRCTTPDDKLIPLKNIKRDVIEYGTATNVTVVTISDSHPSGLYTCNVSNNRVTDPACYIEQNCLNATEGITNITLKGMHVHECILYCFTVTCVVADTPSELNVVRLSTGLTLVNLSWVGSSPMYCIHIVKSSSHDDGDIVITDTLNTYFILNGSDLELNETYMFTVRGVGDLTNNVIHSGKSDPVNITLSK